MTYPVKTNMWSFTSLVEQEKCLNCQMTAYEQDLMKALLIW